MESRVPHHIPGVSSSLISQPLLDGRTHYGHLPHPVTIYPLDQMKSLHVENDYIDSPAVVSQQPPGHKAGHRRITWLGQSQESFLGANHNHHHNHQNHQNHPHQDTTTTHPWISFSGRPSSISSSSSTSSDQRLLDHVAPTPTVDQHAHLHHHHHHHHHHGSVNTVTTRTPGCLASSANPKVLTSASSSSSSSSASSSSKSLDVAPGKAAAPAQGAGPPVSPLIPSSPAEKKHLLLCQQCGKCRCTECTLPRALPSCWVCNQGCLCSAQSLVDTATCMCLVKGVFYHCAEDEDDEGSCADKPCSCHGANCCSRWSFMAAVAMVLPCLVCYLPATGLAKLGQKCYDGVSRPGCRCKNPEGGVGGGGCKSDGVEAKVEALQGKQQQGW